MLDRLIESVEKTFVQFSVRRLLFLVFLVGVVVLGAGYLDSRTGYTSFLRIERVLDSLERLQELETAGIERSERLAPLYSRTVQELEAASYPHGGTGWSLSFAWDPMVKFLSATGLILVFALWGLVKLFRRDPEGLGLFLGALIAAVLVGIPAALLPTIGSLRTTVIGLFIAQIAFFVALSRWQSRKNAGSA